MYLSTGGLIYVLLWLIIFWQLAEKKMHGVLYSSAASKCISWPASWCKINFTLQQRVSRVQQWVSRLLQRAGRVDKNINNWHKYQMLMKISKAIDKNFNLTQMSILTKITLLTKISILTKIINFDKKYNFDKNVKCHRPTCSHLVI